MSTRARRTVPHARPTVDGAGSATWGAWPPPTPGDRPLSMTSRSDGAEHAVMATELEQANRTGHPPVGLCGAVVDPASLAATARSVCRPCREAVARRRRDVRPSPPPPWALLVEWYEALVRLLRSGLPTPPTRALPAGGPAPLALPAPRPLPPPIPADRPVPSPRPRTDPPLRPARPRHEPGGRHRRPE